MINFKNIKAIILFFGLILVAAIIFHVSKPSGIEQTAMLEDDLKDSSSDEIEEVLLWDQALNDNEIEDNVIDAEDDPLEIDIDDEASISDQYIIGNDLPINHKPENSGSFVIIDSVGYEKFKFNEYNTNVYVESINKLAVGLDSSTKIFNLIAPTSSEFNMPVEYKDLSDSQKEGINYAYSNMDNKVVTIDAYSCMESHKEDYLYFKTDHHWTALGAYRAYESFMKAKSEESIPLEKYKRINSENKYLGSIYNMTENKHLENNLDEIWYYEPLYSVNYSCVNRDDGKWNAKQIIFPSYFENSRKYSVFMGGDTAFSHIEINNSIARKILIIKDSYGNAFIPFLLPHYGEVFIADPRYYKDNIFDLIKDNNIDELLIINYSTVLQLPAFSLMLGEMGTNKVTSPSAIQAAAVKKRDGS